MRNVGFTLQSGENWVNSGLPAGNSGSQRGHGSRLQRGGDQAENSGFGLQKKAIRPEIRGSGWRQAENTGLSGGTGSQTTEKGAQGRKHRVRSRKLEVLGTRGARPHMGPAQSRTRPSRRPSPGSPPAPRPALPRPQRAHPPPARPTRSPSLSDQAAAVPAAEARPPTAAARPRAHRLRRRADPRGPGAGPASPRRQAPPRPRPIGGAYLRRGPAPGRPRPRPQAPAAPGGPRPQPPLPPPAPRARGRVNLAARAESHPPPLLPNERLELTFGPRPLTTAAP